MTRRNWSRWADTQRANVQITGGPARVYDADAKPDTMRRPVGFGVIPTPVETPHPLLWEGDNA